MICSMDQDLWNSLEGRKLRMAPLPNEDPWARVGPRTIKRKRRGRVVASLLFLAAACYLLVHFVL